MLSQLQQECADRLVADPLFAHIPVFTEQLQDIESRIQIALGPITDTGGQSGICAILLTPTANVDHADIFGPYFDDVRIVVRVVENVTVNQSASGTGIPAAAVAEKICQLLHHFQPDSATGPVMAQKPTIALGNDPANLSYDCLFHTSGKLSTVLPQVGTPAIVNDSGTLTLTCATAGAAIFYTVDGRNPVPRVGLLYTEVITPGTGVALKARAWLAGYLASETATVNT